MNDEKHFTPAILQVLRSPGVSVFRVFVFSGVAVVFEKKK
jgi:hypothetical protein